MRKLYLIAISLLVSFAGFGQIIIPAKWSFHVEQKTTDEATLIFKAAIDKGYHIYSTKISEEGPIPTSFRFEANPNYTLVGNIIEGKGIEEIDPAWGFKIKYYLDEAIFKQKIKILSADKFNIKGTLEYMACDNNQCFPPEEVEFSFTINSSAKTSSVTPIDTPQASNVITPPVEKIDTSSSAAMPAMPLEAGCGNEKDANEEADMSFLGIFLAGLLGGLLALLTPCVFPMIPLTVSFFTKRSKHRKIAIANAWIYSVSIIAIYVALGLLVTVIFGSDALNDMASSGFFNMLFFVIFMLFAISFFGAFEITLPSAFVNKMDQKSERGGLIGIFFMAFTLSLVSFSCTGPIIGTLLVEAAHGRSYLGPLFGMLGFSVALALPFGFFAVFPNFLHSMPKSGGWLHTVKVSLGFVELALALKFLSNVDLAYHWGILKRETFLALWIVIFLMMGIYLLKDIKLKRPSVVRFLFSMLTLAFAIYLIPGLWGKPLKLVSGLPPPEFYRIWKTTTKAETCPLDLECFHDYEEGMRYAKMQGKPVMIDFTGWSCVNCRKMEDNVWSDPKVLKRLAQNYVLISLYVDDKKDLPESEQFISPLSGKKIKTIGNKWSNLQATVYNTNSQPYYVLLDNKGKLLAKPKGNTPDVNVYAAFLDEGICRYEKRKSEEKDLASR